MHCDQLHKEIGSNKNQTKTLIVIIITVIMMVVEITTGLLFGSIALLSDGIHMGTHTFALLITFIAYVISRRYAQNTNFTFGTGKVGILGGYSSAIVLIIAAFAMGAESIQRFFNPVEIQFNQSIMVACIGLVINLISAWLLKDDHHHHDHDHDHGHGHHHDHNLKAAYLHVLADALTSVLAIGALLAGKFYNANWLDPVVGIAGAIVVTKWGYGLLKTTGSILLDHTSSSTLKDVVLSTVSVDPEAAVTDLHIWQVGSGKHALICTIDGCASEDVRSGITAKLKGNRSFDHVTVEFS
ncbi:MAG: CDF family Co(II)/Ni(II) efflux transporter DmeF [Fibrobacterales bacterium]